ncbi:Gfo/Idh/MocA family protein [Rhizobium rhizogenes]|uniref:Gfo/Idh/MocA family protein n=1 Tax=Rhizobium rhizogenes TaxID=359 RepID=UPI0015740535|nr:Gfo/Idh/MocA family oxidoreductase [Rhizobium rhizogenes]NTG45454.1 Gfo/Idh/MocA family oxidoreductase [Rhizobium rhizogenes]
MRKATSIAVLNIGIIGCGEATQILHIPTLKQLNDYFVIGAVHDASPSVTTQLSASLPGAKAYADMEALLSDETIDAVLVAGPNALHASHAISAMRSGKHVLIEKPMCMTLAEADAIAEEQIKTDRVVQVGYMRRHAAAFEKAVELIAPLLGTINFARVHDIIGPNSAFIEPTSKVIRGDDVPLDVKAANAAADAQAVRSMVGTDEGPRAFVYKLLLGLSSHDVSAMREMLGMPKAVLSAHFRREGWFVTIQFDYGDFICQFETGVDRIARFGAHIEVYTPEKMVRVDYDTPYIRHQPATLTVTSADGPHGVTVSRGHNSRQDSFVAEWRRFHAAITQGATIKTDVVDARLDLELFAQIMQKLGG